MTILHSECSLDGLHMVGWHVLIVGQMWTVFGCQMEASGVGLIVIEDFYRPTMVLGTKGMHLEKG